MNAFKLAADAIWSNPSGENYDHYEKMLKTVGRHVRVLELYGREPKDTDGNSEVATKIWLDET